MPESSDMVEFGTDGAPSLPGEIEPLAPPTEDEEWPDARLTPKQRRFLSQFMDRMDITKAAKAAGVGRRTVYHWQDRSPAFRLAIDMCRSMIGDEMESHAQARAFGGPSDKSSARLLMFFLRAYKPHLFAYRDREAQQMPIVNIIIADGDPSPLPV